MRISQLLALHCRVHKISYEELAKDLGVSKSTICRLLLGKPILARNMLKLINWLFEEIE